MSTDHEMNRLSRLTAIQNLLQTKRITTAAELADRFRVSVRTIYRDIRSLEQAGVPILAEEGRGYTLMEGYRIPPVMFTEQQANALILAEQLVMKNKDTSFIKDYTEAVEKIKAVLRPSEKDKVNFLSERTRFDWSVHRTSSSSNISMIQYALTNLLLTHIVYTNEEGHTTERNIEPFALVSTTENWLLIAWCRLRDSFRYFRLDRIIKLQLLDEKFRQHQMTLQDFFDRY